MARFERDGEVFEITSERQGYAQAMREHLRAGWTRVRDPRVEVSVEGEPREPVLEAALHADPYDAASALVYADWLQQRGHPRGALIALQHLLAARPDDELRAAERRMILDAGDALLSRPLQRAVEVRSAAPGHAPIELSSHSVYSAGTLTWDHGFVRAVALPLRRLGAEEDVLWEVLRHPSCRFLAELALEVGPPCDVGLVAALLLHVARPPLRRLAVHVAHERYRPPTLDLTGLADAYPLVEDLELAVDRLAVGRLALPRLRRLVVTTRSEHDDLLDALAAAEHPALAELGVARANPVHLSGVLAPHRVPALRILRLPAAPRRGAPHVALVARAAIAAQLEELDLGETVLDAATQELLAAQRARFPRLRRLRVAASLVAYLRAQGYPAEPA